VKVKAEAKAEAEAKDRWRGCRMAEVVPGERGNRSHRSMRQRAAQMEKRVGEDRSRHGKGWPDARMGASWGEPVRCIWVCVCIGDITKVSVE
jgi:hypothetical protein